MIGIVFDLNTSLYYVSLYTINNPWIYITKYTTIIKLYICWEKKEMSDELECNTCYVESNVMYQHINCRTIFCEPCYATIKDECNICHQIIHDKEEFITLHGNSGKTISVRSVFEKIKERSECYKKKLDDIEKFSLSLENACDKIVRANVADMKLQFQERIRWIENLKKRLEDKDKNKEKEVKKDIFSRINSCILNTDKTLKYGSIILVFFF